MIVLRAKMNGVDLSPEDIDNLVTDLTMTVTSPKPQPRSAARIELRRSSSSSLVVDKKEIILNSQKLVEDEARKIGNVWKDNWDDDDAESDEEDGEEVSRMQKTLKLRCAEPLPATLNGYTAIRCRQSANATPTATWLATPSHTNSMCCG